MQIQPCTTADTAQLCSLLETASLPTEDIQITKRKLFWKVIVQGNLIATIGLELVTPSIGLLRSLCVKNEYRGHGYAQELVKRVESEAHTLKIEQLFLLTTTAKAYFLKYDYVEVKRDIVPEEIKQSSQFSSLCPSSAIIMKKDISYS